MREATALFNSGAVHFVAHYTLLNPDVIPGETRIAKNGPTWIRTRDRPVMSRWLFQLSYGPTESNPLLKDLIFYLSRENKAKILYHYFQGVALTRQILFGSWENI